jgi:hypothetical protein
LEDEPVRRFSSVIAPSPPSSKRGSFLITQFDVSILQGEISRLQKLLEEREIKVTLLDNELAEVNDAYSNKMTERL